MESSIGDERDTLISKPFPPHVRHAADAFLNKRVLELIRGKCPDNPRSGYAWPLRSILDRTVRVTGGMNLHQRNMCAVLSRFLYDITNNAVNYRVEEDGYFNMASVGLLRWAENADNLHLFRVIGINTNSSLHYDRWGLELPGMNRTKGTYVPEGQTPERRSSGKRRQDCPNTSVGRSPHFSSASSSSSDPPPPPEPTANVKGQSRGEASSSNSVHPPPPHEPTVRGLSRREASSSNSVHPPPTNISTPPVFITSPSPPSVNPSPEANLILGRKVHKLLRSRKYW